MLVRDVMDKHLVSVVPETTVREIAQEIVDHQTPAAFVCVDGVVVGVVAHADILRRIFPSYEEFYDDLVHNMDFEEIEDHAHDIADLTARDVMNKRVLTVPTTMQIMKVAAWMLLQDVYRVAVVDDRDKLVGVVSRGDIFYHTMADELAKAGHIERRKRPRRNTVGRRKADTARNRKPKSLTMISAD